MKQDPEPSMLAECSDRQDTGGPGLEAESNCQRLSYHMRGVGQWASGEFCGGVHGAYVRGLCAAVHRRGAREGKAHRDADDSGGGDSVRRRRVIRLRQGFAGQERGGRSGECAPEAVGERGAESESDGCASRRLCRTLAPLSRGRRTIGEREEGRKQSGFRAVGGRRDGHSVGVW